MSSKELYDFEEQDGVYKVYKISSHLIAIALCQKVDDAHRIVNALNKDEGSTIDELFLIT